MQYSSYNSLYQHSFRKIGCLKKRCHANFIYICRLFPDILQTCEFFASLKDLNEIVNQFESISLNEMGKVKLLDRLDKKYTFPAYRLDEVMSHLLNHYKVLEIDDLRYARYETRYFDTPAYEMYRQHHNRKLNRHKVRFRTYLDSGLQFFEVKFKTNKGRTIKKRTLVNPANYTIVGNAEALLLQRSPFTKDQLQESLRVYYTRITLVSNDQKERVTIDTGLSYELHGKTAAFPGMIIAEVKQDKSGTSSFIHLMKKLRIYDISISKYCLGIATLANNVKINNFKIKLLHVKKLCSASA
jgi:hypothetical protein